MISEQLVTRVFNEYEEIFVFAEGLPLDEVGEIIGVDLTDPAAWYVVETSSIAGPPLTEKQQCKRFLRAEAVFRERVEASFQDYINGKIGGGKLFFFAHKDCLSRAHQRIAQEHEERVLKPLRSKISDYWSRMFEKSIAARKGGAS